MCKVRVLAWVTLALAPSLAFAADTYIVTGSGVRQKAVLMLRVDVFSIVHAMKELPKVRSKKAVIDAACDKRFTLRFMRDVDASKIREAFSEAFKLNGYRNNAKVAQFLSVVKKDIRENDTFVVSYDNEKKTVDFTVKRQGRVLVQGEDFMKAVWSIWLGKIDQPTLSDALIAKIPR